MTWLQARVNAKGWGTLYASGQNRGLTQVVDIHNMCIHELC